MTHSSRSVPSRNELMEGNLSERLAKKKFLRLTSLKPICLLTVSSTQDYLATEMKSNMEGDFVISEVQTQGRGREGRKWASPKGGLWLSINLKPHKTTMGEIPRITTSSILETLRNDYGLSDLQTKLPNDVICKGKKIAGVLVDASIKGSETLSYVGIGVNVNNPISTNSEISDIATSYVDEKGKTLILEDFALSFLVNLDKNYYSLEKHADSTVTEK